MSFRIPGQRVLVQQLIEGRSAGVPFFVRVMIEGVVPADDPAGEPCFEPDAVRRLDELQRLANTGDIAALERVGEVFVRKAG